MKRASIKCYQLFCLDLRREEGEWAWGDLVSLASRRMIFFLFFWGFCLRHLLGAKPSSRSPAQIVSDLSLVRTKYT